MVLINRISRLFRADLHAVLDRIEEPDVLLKQAVREMEEILGNDEQRIKLLTTEKSQLTSRQSELAQLIEQLDDELDICFESDKDDLARGLIKRKLEIQRLQKILVRKHESLDGSITELTKRIEHNRNRLEAMRQKLELINEEGSSTSQDEPWFTPEINIRDEEVEVAFLREKQQRAIS